MTKSTMEVNWVLVELTPNGLVCLADTAAADQAFGVVVQKYSVGWDLAATEKIEGLGYEEPAKPKVNWSVPPGTHAMINDSHLRSEDQRVVVVGPCDTSDHWMVRFVSGDGRLSPPTKISSHLLASGMTCDPIPTHEVTETRGRTRIKPGHSL